MKLGLGPLNNSLPSLILESGIWNEFVQVSGVKVSDVRYEDIHGTSASEVAVKFDCSSTNPCSGIKIQDVKLSYRNKAPQSLCTNAGGMASGFVMPASCL